MKGTVYLLKVGKFTKPLFLGIGNYIYFESSSPSSTGDQAILRSRPILAGTRDQCMQFAYHMYGSSMGELKLEMVDINGTRTQLFYNNISENAWKIFNVILRTRDSDYEVKNHLI